MLSDMTSLLAAARSAAARSVNAIMTATYWEIGRRIVEQEQKGKRRAGYGQELIARLSRDLTERFGRGFSRQSLQQMRQFYSIYPLNKICQSLIGKLGKDEIIQTTSGQLAKGEIMQSPISKFDDLVKLAELFPLPWTAYVRLLSVRDKNARKFYEEEALRGGWTVRQLERQISTQFYERTALSKNKAAMLTKGAKPKPEDKVAAEEEVKDPYVLEFLDLKDEYSESELEESLIKHLESFLLELGEDFTFAGRQKRLRIGDTWFRIDLVLFHRRLRCLVLIDLKLGKLNHADIGQMHLYCNYASKNWTHEDENPPVGLILCAEENKMLAQYALKGLPNKVLTAEYYTVLPDVKTLEAELKKIRKRFERR
jgi:predicted nuclease of restriction endonuclease-like (RecB) superfamily